MKVFENENAWPFADVVARFAEHGFHLHKCSQSLRATDSGGTEELWFIGSNASGEMIWAEVFPYADHDEMPATEVRSICDRLGVSTTVFGWFIAKGTVLTPTSPGYPGEKKAGQG